MADFEDVTEETVERMPPIELTLRDLGWSIAIAIPLLALHITTPAGLPWWLLTCAAGAPLLVGGMLWLKAYRERNPSAAEIVLTLNQTGLTLRRPGRTTRIGFSEITSVVSSSGIDGYGESTMTLLIRAPGRRIAVGGSLLYGSSLLERLGQLPGFDHWAYPHGWADEHSLLHCVWPKRTVLLRTTCK